MMNSPIFFAVFIFFQFSISTPSQTPEDKHFAECCKAAGFGKGIIESACKYPPNVRFFQRAIIGLNFAEYLHCYAAKRDNTTCCKENGISDGCLDMCDGVKQPKKAVNYAFCEKSQTDSDAINNCNKMGAKMAVKEIGKKKNEMKAEEEE